MMGPECVAQQKKLVASNTKKRGDLSRPPGSAWDPCDIAGTGAAGSGAAPVPAPATASTGGRRTSSAAGIINAIATPASSHNVCRQSWVTVISRAARGDIVIGARPIPADTSETASARCVSNQPVTQAIIGAKMAAAPPPTPIPKKTWNSNNE